MPVVPMRDILDPAFAERYGVAAINVVDDLSLEAVLAAATDLRGAAHRPDVAEDREVARRPRQFHGHLAGADRRRSPLPVTLHLDHCPDRAVDLRSACAKGWNSVLFDGSRARRRREHPPDDRGRRGGRRPRRAGRGQDQERPRRRGRHRLRRGGRHPSRRGVQRVHRRDRRVRLRARDRDGPRPLQGRAEADAGAGHRARRRHPIPMVLHGGTGLTDPVHRPHRARLRQGQHLDRAEDRVRRRAPRVPQANPKHDPPAARPRADGGEGDGRAHIRMFGPRAAPPTTSTAA